MTIYILLSSVALLLAAGTMSIEESVAMTFFLGAAITFALLAIALAIKEKN